MKISKYSRLKGKIIAFLCLSIIGAMGMLNTGCSKADFNITGNWYLNFTLESAGAFQIAFSGSKTLGNVIFQNLPSGEYSVAGRDVEFVLRVELVVSGSVELLVYSFTGYFDDKNHMSGTVVAYMPDVVDSEVSGTWSAERL